MSKRFRDTNIGRDPWYRKLSPVKKCLWNFLCDECDVAGVWTIDEEALEFFIGGAVDIDEFIGEVNNGKIRIERFGEDKLFLPGFIEFQYGQLSEHCKPHQKIILLLKKYGLFERVCIPYTKGIHTLQEEEEDKEAEKDKDERGSGGKHPEKRPNIRPDRQPDQPELKKKYEAIINEVKELTEIKEQRKRIADFIQQDKPQFIEPYMDLWNLSIRKHNLVQVEGISKGRVSKFKTRIREPMFDFIKILTEINQSDYLQGKTTDWKVDWDWIFTNDTNYLKILEGKYRNQKN